MTTDIEQLTARLDVQDTVSRLFWYVDERSWDQLADVFAEEVLMDYTSLFGGTPELVPGPEQAKRWSEQLGHLLSTQHVVTNVLSHIAGDEATCTANVTAHLRGDTAMGSPLWRNGGTYGLTLRHTDGTWRVSGLRAALRWADGNPGVLNSP
ncbi:nuclear transport factor 2 family protein [Streptomyces sp. NPDC059534]|uniref:nuclear transport factor 2 family protein n=1 Tax=Streptomyces sp. NPDC059534 TaxID=3346859 RepID=UPI003695F6C8